MTFSPKKIRYLCNKCEYCLPRKLAKKRESSIRRIFAWIFGPISHAFKKPHDIHELIHFKFTNIPFIWSLFCLHVQFIFSLFAFLKFIASPLKLLYTELHRIYHLKTWSNKSQHGYFIASQIFSLFMGTIEKKNHFDSLKPFSCDVLELFSCNVLEKNCVHLNVGAYYFIKKIESAKQKCTNTKKDTQNNPQKVVSKFTFVR